ncbi:MAG: hypothetical protein ACTSXZ_06145, partial [Alphaproteobacteria bacterium]
HFTQPNLAQRVHGKSLAALPYLLDRYEKQPGRKVVFLGSSVLAGTFYTHSDETAPAVAETLLRTEYGMSNLRAYNFAAPGFTMGDMYLLFSRLLAQRPDLLVLSVNVKFFCRVSASAIPVRFPQLWAMARPTERRLAAGRAGLSALARAQSRLDGFIRRHWAMARDLPLWGELQSGRPNPLGRALADDILEPVKAELVSPAEPPAKLRRPEPWRQLPPARVERLREIYDYVLPPTENPNFFFYEKLLQLARSELVPVLVYITPLNLLMSEEKRILDPQAYRAFKSQAAMIALDYDASLIDLSNAVPYSMFGDLDHLTWQGHAILAERLADGIARELAP